MNEQTFTISNPRKTDTIQDWPLGSNRRGPARFIHEVAEKGRYKGQERIGRITKNRFGIDCKTKYSTYAPYVRLVDGSDGKTHILSYNSYGFVGVSSCDMQHTDFSVFVQDANFAEYKEMAQSDESCHDEDDDEQQRRDEKRGLYPAVENIAN